jgi:hypothetical protein
MEEKVLKKSKNGLIMVTLFILLYAAAIAAIAIPATPAILARSSLLTSSILNCCIALFFCI